MSLGAHLKSQKAYRAIYREAHGLGPYVCCFCGEEVEAIKFNVGVVHHVDANPENNALKNLAAAHWGCHTRWHNKGKSWTPEARAKMSAAQKGKRHSPEARAKISAARKGKRLSPETRAKLAGRRLSPETRAKLSAAGRGRKHSPEARAKIGAARRGRKASPATRAKISAVQRGKPSRNKGKRQPRASCALCRREISAWHLARHHRACRRKSSDPLGISHIREGS